MIRWRRRRRRRPHGIWRDRVRQEAREADSDHPGKRGPSGGRRGEEARRETEREGFRTSSRRREAGREERDKVESSSLDLRDIFHSRSI